MTRPLPLTVALLCWLAGAIAPAAHALTVQQEAAGLRVRAASYSALVDAANGARITSLQVDGAEMTHLCPDGHGGLFEETHSADFAFEVLRQDNDGRRLILTLAAKAGTLRISKEFTFSDDQPCIGVRLTFENASPFALSGADAPALRNLALPAGGRATGRELYCMARGRGAEVLSADFLLARAYRDEQAGTLRWMAVSEPAGRRALGFALSEGGSRPLPPLRAQDGGLLTGWAVPAVPAGSSLTVSALLVPLRGFSAVAELDEHFAADVLVDTSLPSPVIHLSLMPLQALPELSVITRTYGADGRELKPCDPLLLDQLEPFKTRQGDVPCLAEGRPAWFVPELYSAGRKVGAFAVPVGQQAGPRPPGAERRPGPVPVALQGASLPGAAIPLTAERLDRGFVLWQFDGPPAADEVQDLRLALAAGEKLTVFLGLRALSPLDDLRMTLAPAAAPVGDGLPPAAVYLWRVVEDASGLARLEPFNEASLGEGETAYLALTVDAARLEPGRYSARLVVSAGQAAREVALALQVVPAPADAPDGFGLWYLGADGISPIDDPTLQKLTDYGVRALTLPMDEASAAAVRAGLTDPQLSRMGMLAFGSSGGVLAPSARAPGALPLPCPDPLWMVRVGASTAASARAAVQAAYSPALLCERLAAVPQEFFQAVAGSRAAWLVEGGPEPGVVPRLVSGGALAGSAPVYLYLDLRGVDWRRAALQVRSAAWAAAWQGLAGLAVTCEAPAREVDRQLALWHILRDACAEAALYRRARTIADAAVGGTSAGPEVVVAQQDLQAVVGPSERSMLPLKALRVPFRQIYRVAPALGEVASLKQFAAARLRTMELSAQLAPLGAPAAPGRLYWRGIPLAESDLVRWAIFAPASQPEAARAAQAFAVGLEALAGRPLPVSGTWPGAGSALIWAFVDDASWSTLPEEVRSVLGNRAGAAFLTADLPDGATVAVVSPSLNTKELLSSLLPAPEPYPTAGRVR